MQLYHSRLVRRLLSILFLLAALLLVLEVSLGAAKEDSFFGLYAWVGFLSCAALIVVSFLIGQFVKRRDSYYER